MAWQSQVIKLIWWQKKEERTQKTNKLEHLFYGFPEETKVSSAFRFICQLQLKHCCIRLWTSVCIAWNFRPLYNRSSWIFLGVQSFLLTMKFKVDEFRAWYRAFPFIKIYLRIIWRTVHFLPEIKKLKNNLNNTPWLGIKWRSKGNLTRRVSPTRRVNTASVYMRRVTPGDILSRRITAVARQNNVAFFLSCLTCRYTAWRTWYCHRFRRFDGVLVISITLFPKQLWPRGPRYIFVRFCEVWQMKLTKRLSSVSWISTAGSHLQGWSTW